METIISRTELYGLVWQHSRVQLAKRFGITEAVLQSSCEAADIPMPGRGHWARREAGHAIQVPPLPPRPFGGSANVRMGDPPPWNPPVTEDDIPLPPVPDFPELMESVAQRARAAVARGKTYKDLRHPHELFKRSVLAHDMKEAQRAQRAGVKHSLSVIDQRKRIVLNNLVWLLQPVGCGFEFRVRLQEIYLYIGAMSLNLVFSASPGALALRLAGLPEKWDVTSRWADGPTPLEAQCTDIAADLLANAEAMVRWITTDKYQWAIKRRQELRDEAEEKAGEGARKAALEAEETERGRRARLYEHAERLVKSDQIRALIHGLSARQDFDRASPEFSAWVAWATAEAEKVDPRLLPWQQVIV